MRCGSLAHELGVPYRYGGSSPSGFDCSGLVAFVYGKLGIALPHNAAAQYGYGAAVDRAQLKPGDLLYFHGSVAWVSTSVTGA